MKILLVEDEPLIRSAELAYLKQAGYEIIEADDGEKALQSFKENAFDLVILDINLPIVNGIQVCKKIRKESTIPIIMVTARNQDEDELLGLELGADDYIKKPFNPHIFVKRVQKLLEKNKQVELNILDLIISPAAQTVMQNGKEIRLTKIQFNLLYTLASNAGTIFSRNMLLDKMYDDHIADVFPRTIDAHIKALRKALGDNPNSPHYIETIMGSGYKFRKIRND